MLPNAYLRAKFRFDTAENEPAKNLQNFAKFQENQLDNLVDLEKCCKAHIILQSSASIQPRTSPPKIYKILQTISKFANFANPNPLTGSLIEVRRRAPRALPRRGGAPRALLHADLRRGLRLAARARAAGPGPPPPRPFLRNFVACFKN